MKKQEAPAPAPTPFPENWDQMTGDEKFQYFASGWTSTAGKQFASPEIAEAYQKRTQRFLDVIALKEPDEVPVYLLAEGFILEHGGIQPVDTFYHPEKHIPAAFKMHDDFDLDYSVMTYAQSGSVLDTLGVKLIRWPGSSVNPLPDDTGFQYIEDEYMRADEYDELINNPEGYILRKYLPRICTGLGGLADLPNAFNMVEATGFTGTLFGLSTGTPLRQSLDLLLRAADQSAETMLQFLTASMQIVGKYGAPSLLGGIAFAPYDILGDTMRCTMGIMKDLYRCPDKVLAAVDALTPMAIQMGVQMATASRVPFILIPLHKGADGFMSPDQFKKFYWPFLKATMQGMIDAGCIPVPFVEGSFNQRLDIMAADPLPKGKSLWIFDRTDMKTAKEKVGSWACISGNVPASLFKQGSVQELEAYCKTLIETCAPGGGFCVSPGAVIDHANPENIKAFVNCGRKFGK